MLSENAFSGICAATFVRYCISSVLLYDCTATWPEGEGGARTGLNSGKGGMTLSLPSHSLVLSNLRYPFYMVAAPMRNTDEMRRTSLQLRKQPRRSFDITNAGWKYLLTVLFHLIYLESLSSSLGSGPILPGVCTLSPALLKSTNAQRLGLGTRIVGTYIGVGT